MNSEDIIRMAKEVDLIEWEVLPWNKEVSTPTPESLAKLHKFAAIVAATEREECAQICDKLEEHFTDWWRVEHDPNLQGRATGAVECAYSIRARRQA